MNNLNNFWENCDKNFSHIEISGHLKSYNDLTNNWEINFLKELRKIYSLDNKTIIDYGIGGAYLGIHLKKDNIKKYIGIDIAKRQLEVAKRNLLNNNIDHELFLSPQDFSAFNADLFISQAVIQHFPDLEYLNNFILNLNSSKIPIIVLQIRYDKLTNFKDGNYCDISEVCWKCTTNNIDILKKLTNYKNIYEGVVLKNKYQFLFYKLNND